MTKSRIEAFSDGVFAILITIMVFDLKPPTGSELVSLRELGPLFQTYVLSFLYLGIYWNNHHHLFQAARVVTGGTMWANLHLLFWLSLLPFATRWMRVSDFAPLPTAMYGVVLLLAAFAYLILQTVIVRSEGANSRLRDALGRDWRGKFSPVLYLLAIVASFYDEDIAFGIYAFVALMWLIPDKRIEARLKSERE